MLTEQYAEYAAKDLKAKLSDDVIHHAKRAVIDWYACLLPGSIVAPATLLELAMAEDLDRGKARLASGRRATMRTAALINGTASHAVEFDDIFRDAGFHPGAPVISASLAAAQATGANGDTFLRGVIIGYEICTRIGVAVMPSHYNYWHSTGTLGSFGAAAATASIIGCNQNQIAHAMATAGTFASGLQQAFRSQAMSKPLHAGHAADVGTMAAMSALNGVTGALDIIEGEVGFGAAMSDAANWSRATEGLGRVYNITQMTFKNHGCCGHNFAPLDGLLDLQQANGFTWQQVKKVKLATYKSGTDIVNNPSPKGEYQAKFSLQYVAAHTLMFGSVRLDAFTPERMANADLRALMAKIEVSADPELSKGYPGQRAAYVTVELADGRTLNHFQPFRKGDPEMPLTDDELNAKFMELALPVTGEAIARQLLVALWSLDKAKTVDFEFTARNKNAA